MLFRFDGRRIIEPLAEQVGGAHRELGTVVDAELVEDRVEIDLHRSFGDAEPGADVAVAKALADEVDELALARRQRRRDAAARSFAWLNRSAISGSTQRSPLRTVVHAVDAAAPGRRS